MPEGDTIYRLARALDRALAGQAVTSFESAYPALTRVNDDTPVVGRTVVGARAAGKHLLLEFSGGLVLLTHLRMHGRWHLCRQGESWRGPRAAARIAIGTRDWVAVAFGVPVAEFVDARLVARHPAIAALGPDLLAADFDEAGVLTRLARLGDVDIASALLNQRVVAGIGNVFKSEILFVSGVDPFRRVSALSEAERKIVIAEARRLLRANVAEDPAAARFGRTCRRTTRSANPAERLWVYGRDGRPCRRCGAAIACRKHGPDARLTYWCPACQR